MTACDNEDVWFEGLRRLQALTPDQTRAEGVRIRCRVALRRSRTRQARRDMIIEFAQRVLAPVAVGVLCILYMTDLMTVALRLRGVLD